MSRETKNESEGAKSHLAEIDRMIALLAQEEIRVAKERKRLETERDQIANFIEMMGKYAKNGP